MMSATGVLPEMFFLVFVGTVLKAIDEYAPGIAAHKNRAAVIGSGCDLYFEDTEEEHTWHFQLTP